MAYQVFQPTLPRGERQEPVTVEEFEEIISTHAPTRGATVQRLRPRQLTLISTHAPTRGATYKFSGHFTRSHISTHAPTMGATEHPQGKEKGPAISTHAPTRGATSCPSFHVPGQSYFNPRSHEGSDYNPFKLLMIFGKFQPTLPRGERR